MTSMSDCVLVEEIECAQGKIGVLTLNAPKTLNSLTLDMVRRLYQALKAWQDEESIAIIVLKGMGEKAFCAGGDVQKLYESAVSKPGGPCEYAETFFLEEYQLDYLIHTYDKPILCLGHGIVMGGGLGLMAGASHRVCTEKSRIAMPEITIGLYPDVGGTYFLNKMPHRLGYFFGLTGASINGHDALLTGLADVCMDSQKLSELEDSLKKIEWQPDIAINRDLLDYQLSEFTWTDKDLDQLVHSNIKPHASTLELIGQSACFSELISVISKLDTDDPWLVKAQSTLKAGSPLSSLLIYEQLLRNRSSNLEEVFLSEYQLSTNIVRFPEFAEGVRALLIDKDNAPSWQFSHFSDVPSSLIERMFQAQWEINPLKEKLSG